MRLAPQEVEQFNKLIWSLQLYANRRLGLVPEVSTLEDLLRLPVERRIRIRNAPYDHVELIDEYVKENPEGFSEEELEILRGWKRFVRGDFFVERLLKKYAVFIKGDRVYGVLALHDPFEEFLPRVPCYVNTVLLPFRGRIVYDGWMQIYNVTFGRGIRESLKETYMAAKVRGEILESLDPKPPAPKKVRRRKDWTPLLDELEEGAKALRAGKDAPAIWGPAFSLMRASLEFARIAAEDPEDLDRLRRGLRKVERAMRKAERTLVRLKG